MMEKMKDFFIPENRVDDISGEDYEKAEPVVSAFRAFSRISYQSVYIVDYHRQNFLYVSENPLFLCGLQPEEVQKMGYAFYFNYVPEEELNMLLEINKAGFEFFKQTPVEDRIKLSISYDFHIRYKDIQHLINHKLTPVLLSGNGNIWLAACVVSPASHQEVGHVEARLEGNSKYWVYSFESRKWEEKEDPALNNREKAIILLTVQGLTMEEIAGNLCISESTVKFHKQSLFKKLNVRFITEAISVASNYKLI